MATAPPRRLTAMDRRPLDNYLLAAAWAVLVLGLAMAVGNVLAGQSGLRRHLIDSYYYFEAADNVGRSGLPRIDWPQGPANKYFPGYGVALGGWSAVLGAEPWQAWHSLQVVLLVAIAPAAVGVFRRLGFAPWAAVLAGALVATNPVLQRWCGVPFSEPLCLLALLLQALVALTPTWRGRPVAASWPGVVAMGVLGGVASATRIEGAVLQLPLLVAAWRVGGVRSWGRLAVVAAVAMAPLAVWLVAFSGGQTPHYVTEGRSFFVFALYFNKFWNSLANTVRYYQLQSGQMWLHVGYWATWHTLLVALFVAMRGLVGPAARVWASLLLGFFLLHGFWYYQSDRYVIVVLPLVYAVLVAGVHWLFEQTPPPTPLARPGHAVAMAILLAAQVMVHGASRYILDDHVAAINSSRSDDDHQMVAAALPGEARVLTDLGPELALWHTGTTWFVSRDTLNYPGLEAEGPAGYARALPDGAPALVVLGHEPDTYPALAALMAVRGAVAEAPPVEGISVWRLPAAGAASAH